MKMVQGFLSLIPSCNLSSLQHQKMMKMMIPFFVAKLKSISFIRHLCSPSSTKRPLPSTMSASPPRKLRKLASHSLKECAKTQPQPQSIQDDGVEAHDNNGSNRFDSGNIVMGTKDVLQRVFAFIDEDCDGRLSLDEIRVFLNEKMGISISPEELQALVSYNNSEVDKLGSSPSSSFMDLGLFESILTGGSGILGHVQKEEEKEKEEEEEEEEDVKGSFCVFDSDGDGFISAKELHSCLARMGFKREMEVCEAIITTLDLDGNGLLDFSEFNQMMNSFTDPPPPPPPPSPSSSSSSSSSASSSSSLKM